MAAELVGIADAEIAVSIVLPCLNEAAAVGKCVRDAWSGLHALRVTGEVIVSDSGSTDDSQAIATAAGAKVVVAPSTGYGAALRHGIAHARGRCVIIADSDGSYDLTTLAPIWQRLMLGDDLVVGNRFRGHIANDAMPFLNRRVGNPFLSAFGRRLTHTTVGDFHSGMRGFHRAAAVRLQLRADGMEFASEMIARAAAHHLIISEVPINLTRAQRTTTGSHLRPVRDGLRHIRTLLALRQ